MRVIHRDNKFICVCSFEERQIPRDAGFRWDRDNRYWYTPSYGVASRLSRYADENAKNLLERTLLTRIDWTGGAAPYPENLKPKPFQLDQAVPFALTRNRSYLALDPGLGKTICAALIRNALKWPAVYICPPFLMGNVEEEMRKWWVGDRAPVILRVNEYRANWQRPDLLLIPDSLLTRQTAISAYTDFLTAVWEQDRPVVLFVDEAHRFKTESAARTTALFKNYTPHVKKVVFLSGTPMPNRPMELYPLLSNCAPELIGFMNRFEYGLRYCAAFKGAWGWDFTGASNVQELAGKILGSFMLRLRKEDVLPELPSKQEELVFIDSELPPMLAELSGQILARYSPDDLMRGRIGDEHVSTYRRKLGELKAPAAAEYVRFCLEQSTEESFLVFAIHRDTIAVLADQLSGFAPIVITGDVEKDERFRLAKLFQSDKRRRVMILNITAGGVGFNLTKATRVVFAEFSWVPAENDQAIDRAHRIGQDSRVLAQFLVHRNSIDRDVMEVVLRKRETTQYV